MTDKRFAWTHYLQAGVKATKWADKHLRDGDDALPLAVKIPIPGNKVWEFPFHISEFTIVDSELNSVMGVVRWHGDGFWVFEPSVEELG